MRIRRERLPTLVTVLSLTLLVLSPNVLAQDLGQEEAGEAIETTPDDVCAPLYDAESIFASLQASPNAHLDKKIVSTGLSGQGWGDGLGWGHEGPLSTTFRMLPRLLNFLSPKYILERISAPTYPSGSGKTLKITKARKRRVEQMMAMLQEAEEKGCDKVWAFKGHMRMFPPKGVKQDLPAAFKAYKRSLSAHGDPEAQFMVGVFHATGLGGVEEDQGKALLYYTFSALQGYRPAEMALGYRHWAGISVQESCSVALDYYEAAANRAYQMYTSGPPGGLTLPLTTTRLSDRVGGIYGPQASWASTGANAFRAASKASTSNSRGETEQELIEYFQYHSDRNSYASTIRLGRYYYTGSIYTVPGGLASGAEGVGEIPQSFGKAKEYFMKVARVMWPMEYDPTGKEAGRRRMSKEMEDSIREPAMFAAGFLGRMALRGEGQKPDYKRARLWLERAAELGERESLNSLGIIHRDGLIVPVDTQKAYKYFQAAAGQDLAEAQVNLAKLHLERNQVTEAMQYLESAIRHGSPFEAFHLYASIHAQIARRPVDDGGKPGFCGAAVAWYKLVSERGSWSKDQYQHHDEREQDMNGDNYVLEAEKAWARGEEGQAMVGWFVAAELGNEAAQNNLGWLLEKGIGKDVLFPPGDVPIGFEAKARVNEMAMRWWIRSAAQDNVDSMVKVGDYYYAQTDAHTPTPESHTLAAAYYQTAADTSLSAMAYWNLGWMYENGIGVKRDWWLAKRNYDQAGDMGGKLPVLLSLGKLYLRSWYTDILSGGSDPGLNFFEPKDDLPGLWTRIKSLFTPLIAPDEAGDGDSEWEDHSETGSGWRQDPPPVQQQQQPQRRPGGGGAGGGVRDGGGRDMPGAQAEGGNNEFELDEVDDLLETLVILGVMLGIAGLVLLRQRWDAVRANVGI